MQRTAVGRVVRHTVVATLGVAACLCTSPATGWAESPESGGEPITRHFTPVEPPAPILGVDLWNAASLGPILPGTISSDNDDLEVNSDTYTNYGRAAVADSSGDGIVAAVGDEVLLAKPIGAGPALPRARAYENGLRVPVASQGLAVFPTGNLRAVEDGKGVALVGPDGVTHARFAGAAPMSQVVLTDCGQDPPIQVSASASPEELHLYDSPTCIVNAFPAPVSDLLLFFYTDDPNIECDPALCGASTVPAIEPMQTIAAPAPQGDTAAAAAPTCTEQTFPPLVNRPAARVSNGGTFRCSSTPTIAFYTLETRLEIRKCVVFFCNWPVFARDTGLGRPPNRVATSNNKFCKDDTHRYRTKQRPTIIVESGRRIPVSYVVHPMKPECTG